MEKLWTMSEVAKYLGIQEVDVEQRVRQGKITGYKLGGQFLRFRPDQVEALKGTMQFRPTAGKPLIRQGGWGFSDLHDFLYFFDFYLVSAALLAVMVVYLVIAG